MSSRNQTYSILFGCVADNRKIKYYAGDSSFKEIASLVISRAPLDCRKSFSHEDRYTVNYIAGDSRIWLCVAQKELNTRICFAYLENIRKKSMVSDVEDPTLSGFMRSSLEKYNSSNDRVSEINKEISAIREVMIENLAAVLRRGERLEDLEAKSQALSEDSALFRSNATKLKSHFRWANLRWYLIGFGVLCIIALAIAWGVCGLRFQRCKHKSSSSTSSLEFF